MALSKFAFEPHQKHADEGIFEAFACGNDDCLIKMFCGTGKSLVMRRAEVLQAKSARIIAYVFPSLALIDQFTNDYLTSPHPDSSKCEEHVIKISSDKDGATTDISAVVLFFREFREMEARDAHVTHQAIVCVTYQSLDVLADALDEARESIDVAFFDEAHHSVAPTYRKYIYDRRLATKQAFFTATPTKEMTAQEPDGDEVDSDRRASCRERV